MREAVADLIAAVASPLTAVNLVLGDSRRCRTMLGGIESEVPPMIGATVAEYEQILVRPQRVVILVGAGRVNAAGRDTSAARNSHQPHPSMQLVVASDH
jgi:hypothetical protein